MDTAERLSEEIGEVGNRVLALEQQSIIIARMEENINFIKQRIDEGLRKSEERLQTIEGVMGKHNQLMNEHPQMCKDLSDLRKDFEIYRATNKGKWSGAHTLTLIGMGLLNLILLLLILIDKLNLR